MKRFNLEITVGVFVLLGILAMAYISVQLGQIPIGGGDSYPVTATFSTAGGVATRCRCRNCRGPGGARRKN